VRSSGVIWIPVLMLCVGLLLGCGSSAEAPKTASERHNPLPPDAGTATGHGTDRTRVQVPERDASPPMATIALSDAEGGRTLAEASRPGSRDSGEVELREPRVRGTAVGEDANGGIVRVRVSISERISCLRGEDERFERLRTRYFPPPQIEQIRAAPGARLPTRGTRSRLVSLVSERCGPGAAATEVHGRLWAEVINGRGLETITPSIRFGYVADADDL
jgi:hypothetical protein